MEIIILLIVGTVGYIYYISKLKKQKYNTASISISDKKSDIKNTIQEKIAIKCPYCNTQLKKIPSRKSKCKSCDNYIYVRTDYKTKEKIFLTDKQLNIYDAEAENYYQKNDIKRRLFLPFEKELNNGEEIRNILDKHLADAKNEWHWGVYRNITSKIGDLNYLEDKKLDALKCYLEVIYYDINNPNNVGSYAIKNNLQEQYPAFSPLDLKVIEASSYWIDKIINDAQKLNIKDIKTLFIEHNTIKYNELKVIPNKPEIIWEIIKHKF